MKKEKDKNKLTAIQYWEWRTTISEMQHAAEKLRATQLEFKLLQKDAENLSIRSQLFLRTRMDAAKGGFEKAQAEYERFKKVIESDLGQSLNNKVIDDVTFEVRELPDEKQQSPEING